MKPIVYIDMLFVFNFLMNSIILYSSTILLHKKIHILRMLISSAIGAVYSCILFFPQLNFVCSLIFKLLLWLLCTFIAFPSRSQKELLKNALTYFSVNLIFGGVMFFLIFMTDFGTTVGTIVSNGEIYFDISFGTVITSAMLAHLTISFITYIRKQNLHNKRHFSEITVFFNEKSITFQALCDTGCNLCDPISGYPAVIISNKLAKTLLPSVQTDLHFRILPFSTVSGAKNVMSGFIPDKLTVNGIETIHSVVGISPLYSDKFNSVFNPDLINNQNMKGAEQYDKFETCI